MKKFLSVLLVVCFCISFNVVVFAAPGAGDSEAQAVIGKGSEAVVMGASVRTDFISIALAEVGYMEKATNAYLDDPDANVGSNNFTKYGQWMGANGLAWCSSFVAWCAAQAGISSSIVYRDSSPTDCMNFYKENNRFYSASSSYTPQVGDIFFTGSSGSSTTSTHTGIVIAVSTTTITVVDGNWSDQVSQHTYHRDNTYNTNGKLIGYGHPAYCPSGHLYYISYDYATSGHWRTCSVCGTPGTKSEHVWRQQGTGYSCSVCKMTTPYLPSNEDEEYITQ